MPCTSKLETVARWTLAFAVLLLVAGCASTYIASTWRDPEDKGGPIKKLLILVISRDDAIRKLAENRAVQSMPPGTVGVPSYTMFAKLDPDEEKVKARLIKDGFDGVLVSRLASHEKSEQYVPPQTYIAPSYFPMYGVPPAPYYRSFYGYYPYAYSYYVSPGYTTETQRYVVETLLYRLPEGKPVWSAVSETVDPASKIVLVNEILRIVGQELRKQHLIGER